ncbi:MAG: hypothetical protein ACKO3W_09360 [bacterium]
MRKADHTTASDAPLAAWGNAQWRAMSSPLRFELELVAGSICPATAQDFAEATGRTRASIYPHLQAMVDAGFLVVSGHRPSARRPVAIYNRGPMMDVPPYDVNNFDRAREWIRASDAYFRLHAREHQASIRAMEGGSTLLEGLDVHYLFGKIMHLDRAGMQELIELKNQLREFAERYAKPNGGEIVRMMLAIIPDQRTKSLQTKRGRRKSSGTAKVKKPAK